MAPGPEDVVAAPSPGGESVVSASGNKREASSTPADDGGAGRKKKKTGPGSRGVANLTPEQLAKKRANGELANSYVHVGVLRWQSLVESW